MAQAFSSSSGSQQDSFEELILSFEHSAELAPDTPKLSYYDSSFSSAEFCAISDGFVLNGCSEVAALIEEEPAEETIARLRAKRKIVKRKSQNGRQTGKASL